MLDYFEAYKGRVYFVLMLLVAVLIPTAESSPIKLASISVILLGTWWVISGRFKVKYNILKKNKLVWLFIALFIINLLSLLRSDNIDEGLNLITRKLSLLLFPLIIATSPKLGTRQINYIILGFISSLFIISCLTFREGITIVLDRVDLTNLVRMVYIHRPYFGLFSAFAVAGLIFLFFSCKSLKFKSLFFLAAIYFLFYIYILYAKMTVIAIITLPVILAGVALAKKLNLYVNLAIVGIFLLTVAIVLQTNESVRIVFEKITSFEDFSYQDYNIHLVSSINIRYINWGCSVRILQQDNNWITGLGVGDVQEQLNLCYKGLNPWIYELQQNAHNEYLEEMLRNGVVGLMLLLLSIGIPLGLSLHQKNYLYFSFLILFAICSITENMLSRQTGVMFFAFFNSLFAFNTLTSTTKTNSVGKPSLMS